MKLPITPLSQKSPEWRYKKLGTGSETIGTSVTTNVHVKSCVFPYPNELQVLYSVIGFISVYVMNLLALLKGSMKRARYYKPMLHNISMTIRHRIIRSKHLNISISMFPLPAFPVRVFISTKNLFLSVHEQNVLSGDYFTRTSMRTIDSNPDTMGVHSEIPFADRTSDSSTVLAEKRSVSSRKCFPTLLTSPFLNIISHSYIITHTN